MFGAVYRQVPGGYPGSFLFIDETSDHQSLRPCKVPISRGSTASPCGRTVLQTALTNLPGMRTMPYGREPGGTLAKLRAACRRKEYREPAFMNILRYRLFTAFPAASLAYGAITAASGKTEDARPSEIPYKRCCDHSAAGQRIQYAGRYCRHPTYSPGPQKMHFLHEAVPRKSRQEPNRGAIQNAKNTKSACYRDTASSFYDKTGITGTAGWITGFTGTAAYVKS